MRDVPLSLREGAGVDSRASDLEGIEASQPRSGAPPALSASCTARDGPTGLASGLGQAAADLATSAGQLAALQPFPVMMSQLQLPGINTTVGALGQTGSGLGTGVAEMRKGEALTTATKTAADEHTSFLGAPQGATGNLSVLFKLEGVSKQ